MSRITVEELDRKFDDGEDVSEYFDWSQAKSGEIGRDLFLVKLREGTADAIAAEAARRGVPVDQLISLWVDDRLKRQSDSAAE